MSNANSKKDAAALCAGLVREKDFTRYASTLFVPATQRRSLLALYAFNVEISRVREQVSQPLPGEMRLQWWTDMLEGAGLEATGLEGTGLEGKGLDWIGLGGVEGNPVAAELLLAIKNNRLPVERLSRLIDEHQFDLYNDPMPTLAALESYASDTSAALFSLAARIAGYQSEEIEHLSRHAGLAQGIALVMASLPLDASRRQLFVPLQVLESHGLGMEDLFAGQQTPKIRIALDQLLDEAQAHLKTAISLLGDIADGARPVFLPLASVARDLKWMSRADCDPFVPYATSRFRTLWTLWRASRSRVFS